LLFQRIYLEHAHIDASALQTLYIPITSDSSQRAMLALRGYALSNNGTAD
jgi:hypothetical protein